MASQAPLPPFAAVIVAAGKGLRIGGEVPKQFREFKGKPLVRHSVEKLLAAGADPLVDAIPSDAEDLARTCLAGLDGVDFVIGGETRRESVRNGLTSFVPDKPQYVLIHDAARPDIPLEVIERLLSALDEHAGAIPVLPVVDTLAIASERNTHHGNADRETLRRVQTPQAFRGPDIMAAHFGQYYPEGAPEPTDDAQVLMSYDLATNRSVAFVQGDERLKKITFAEDLMETATAPAFRVGQGFDVHRLVEGEELWLCGIQLEHTHGLAGHSDADVALHAITDAVLGAIGNGDIGTHFPPSDPQWAGARSGQFLENAVKLARDARYALSNIDLTIICEAPKIGPHRPAMRTRVSELTGLGEVAVSIKATTTERLGFTGRGEGIAAQAIVGLVRLGD